MNRGRILLSALLLAIAPAPVSASEKRPPNVVLIISDDQGWTDYSFMGHPSIKTPRLDRLAAESLTFRRGYVPSSLCSPSLASILTGLYPHQHRVTSNDPPAPVGLSGRAAAKDATYAAQRREMIGYFSKSPTLPRLLKQKGYVSLQTGKWWGGAAENGGFTQGMTHGDPEKGGRHGDTGLRIGRQGMKEAFDFIDSATEKNTPFFLWYAPMMPHSPHNPPERFLKNYRDKAPSLEVAKYWAMCEWFDETCGELLDRLDVKGLRENTLVVYVTDNGWIQDRNADRYAPKSKQSQYDGGVRTPIMLRLPGVVRPETSDALASSIDLAPTILAVAGLSATGEMTGANLLDKKAVEDRTSVFGEIFTHNAVDIRRPATSLRYRWVIDGYWKLIVPAAQNTPNGEIELYDLRDDPHESKNLASLRGDDVGRLKRRLDAWWPGDVRP